jgi:hypothetical protein
MVQQPGDDGCRQAIRHRWLLGVRANRTTAVPEKDLRDAGKRTARMALPDQLLGDRT